MKKPITDDEIRAIRRKRPSLLDLLMTAIHSTDKEFRALARAEFQRIRDKEQT